MMSESLMSKYIVLCEACQSDIGSMMGPVLYCPSCEILNRTPALSFVVRFWRWITSQMVDLRSFKVNVMELPACPNWVWKYYRPVKFLFQRWTRGWDDSDLWSLDYAIIKFTYPRLKAFRELPPAGVPCHPTGVITEEGPEKGYPRALTEKEWDSILGEILVGFKMVLDEGGYPIDPNKHAQIEKSMDLFRQWFFALWD